jgi:hypothetical protein
MRSDMLRAAQNSAAEVLLGLLEEFAAAYPAVQRPARV